MAGYGTTTFSGLEVSGYAFPKVIEGTLPYTAFGTVNGTVAVGTIGTIPAGASVFRSAVTAITGFTGGGNATATATIGDSTDVDRYNTSTFNVFATAANGVDTGAPSGTVYHTAGTAAIVRITAGSAFGSITAGSLVAKVYYFD